MKNDKPVLDLDLRSTASNADRRHDKAMKYWEAKKQQYEHRRFVRKCA